MIVIRIRGILCTLISVWIAELLIGGRGLLGGKRSVRHFDLAREQFALSGTEHNAKRIHGEMSE